MKKIFMLAAFVAVMGLVSSCGSSKQATSSASEWEDMADAPCSGPEYQTSSTAFRATAAGLGSNMEGARKAATLNARTELASSMESILKNVTDLYVDQHVQDELAETKELMKGLTRGVVNKKLNSTRVICQKYQKKTVGNKATYQCYVTVELLAADVLAAYNSEISNDSKMRTTFEYEKFKKDFEEEMSKFQQQ